MEFPSLHAREGPRVIQGEQVVSTHIIIVHIAVCRYHQVGGPAAAQELYHSKEVGGWLQSIFRRPQLPLNDTSGPRLSMIQPPQPGQNELWPRVQESLPASNPYHVYNCRIGELHPLRVHYSE
jgi:hypothetical protein